MNTVVCKLKATVILILAVACIILWMQTTGLAHQMIYYGETLSKVVNWVLLTIFIQL